MRPSTERLQLAAQPPRQRASGSRLSSRTSPSNVGVRTAARNTALTTDVDAVERLVRRRPHRRLDSPR